MRDERGIYYHPAPADKNVRMYVRQNELDKIEFRLFNATEPEIWERHPWLPHEVIRKAADMYRSRSTSRNPMALYDLDVARRLLEEEGP